MTGLVNQFTFFAGCLARTPFRAQVAAAARAGFDSISIWPNVWRHALRKDGLTFEDMRLMVADLGLKLTDIDAYRDWAPAPTRDTAEFGPVRSGISLRECLDAGQQLGATTLVAVHLTDAALDLDRDTEAFARLCDEAAESGMRVGLEFVAFGNIPDVATATKIVEGAGRANGGLVVDLWHHARSSNDDEALARIPPAKVYTVQFCDGPVRSPVGLVEEAMFHRQFPGKGELDVTGFLQLLDRIGVQASVGAELYQREFENRSPDDVAQDLAQGARAAFAAAGVALPSPRAS